MEAIITIVGFLGAGKTTLLKRIATNFIYKDWKPFVILNDYEDAYVDAQQFHDQLEPSLVQPLNGSCICCSGINELREYVNRIPKRDRGVTIIEANGTSDACSLNGFLSIGINERFLPPVQISVVDVQNWQKRGEYNELEANQIQVSSLIVLTHLENLNSERIEFVKKDIQKYNPFAKVIQMEELNVELLPKLIPSSFKADLMEHHKAHWSSCSVDLPIIGDAQLLQQICEAIPKSIQRVKGCVKVGSDAHYTFFERLPSGKVIIRPFKGEPIASASSKLLTIGPGSNPDILNNVIESVLSA